MAVKKKCVVKKKAVKKKAVKKKATIKTEDKKLTAKQNLFVLKYLVSLNATQAAIDAGYSERTAGTIGNENMQKPAIQQAIKAAMDKREADAEVDAAYVLKKAKAFLEINLWDFIKIGSDGQPVYDFSNATREQLACIDAIQIDTSIRNLPGEDGETETVNKIKITLPSKLKSLELLGKHIDVGAFSELHKHTGKIEHEHTAKEQLDFSAIRARREEVKKNVH